MGWLYIKEDRILLKKEIKKIIKYIFNINKIEKIEKKYIIIKKKNIKITLNNIDIRYIKYLINNKIKSKDLAINKICEDYNVINWAMNIDDDRIDIYDKNFDISYIDLSIFIKYPIKFRVKNIAVEKYTNIIKMYYNVEDSFLVYMIIDEWYKLYEIEGNIEIRLGDEIIEWEEIKILKIEYLIEKIIKNKKCEIEIINGEFYYEMSIKYNNIDITSTF
jgi:hypothetical protein